MSERHTRVRRRSSAKREELNATLAEGGDRPAETEDVDKKKEDVAVVADLFGYEVDNDLEKLRRIPCISLLWKFADDVCICIVHFHFFSPPYFSTKFVSIHFGLK